MIILMELGKLVEELTLTHEDFAKVDEETKRIIEYQRGNLIPQFPSNFAFTCIVCDESYIILKSKEPVLGEQGRIFEIQSQEDSPKYHSHLNYIREEGYICDHCRDSINDSNLD